MADERQPRRRCGLSSVLCWYVEEDPQEGPTKRRFRLKRQRCKRQRRQRERSRWGWRAQKRATERRGNLSRNNRVTLAPAGNAVLFYYCYIIILHIYMVRVGDIAGL